MNASYTEIILAGCILVLPFLYESSHVFRYHLKFLLYYGIVMLNSVILIPLFACRAGNVRNLLWVIRIGALRVTASRCRTASAWCHHISTLLGLRWIVRGREHLEKDQACIIVCNHQSSIDILGTCRRSRGPCSAIVSGMFDIWPVMDKCTVVAKKELFYAWPFGIAAWLCGLIFIPRMNSDRARALMNQAAENIKKDKIKLWVFPEGTRRNTGQIHPFKKGAFHLALSSQLPILPVVFSQYYFLDKVNKRFDHGRWTGTVGWVELDRETTFWNVRSGSKDHKLESRWRLKGVFLSGKVYVTVLPPISTQNMTLDDMDRLMDKTRNVMTATFHEANKEVKDSMTRSCSSQ
jgi:lysophosphatidate acyltransferase